MMAKLTWLITPKSSEISSEEKINPVTVHWSHG